MKRLKPEEVLKAYEETGLRPRQGKFFQDDCACGLGAVARQAEPTARGDNAWDILLKNGFGDFYLNDFYYGFDQIPQEQDKLGYKDGQAAWGAVKHLVVTS